MSVRNDSTLVKLVRGEGEHLWLSRAERGLVKFALGTFGEALSELLLTGLGEEAVEQRWRLTITYAGGGAATYERRLRVITHEPLDGHSLLPRRRDPLALLALLQLLVHGHHEPKSELIYDMEDVLKLLGWPDAEDARREIDGALERYSNLTYVWDMSGDELAGRDFSFCKGRERPISDYTTTDSEAGGPGRARRVFNRVVFDADFIDGLQRRSLFGIDWNRTHQVTRKTKP